MSTLTGRKIANSYKNLLQVETSNTDLDTSLRNVQTGAGNNTPLQLSTDKINLTGTLQINGTTLTAGAATLNAVADLTGTTGLVAVSAGNIHGRSIAVGNPLTISNANGTEGNPTINLASSGVSAATYGPMVNFTVDNFGRITDVTVTTTISANAFVGGTISGSALTVENDTSIGGDVVIEGTTNMKAISATDVTFNNLTVNTKINAVTVTATTIETSILRATTISVTDLTADNINFDNVSVSSLVANVGLFNGDVTFTGDSGNIVFDKSDNALEFADNVKAVFGTGGDLEITHLGTYSRIKDGGTGNLVLAVDDLQVTNSAVTENILRGIEDGAVELYYDNSKKFETTSTGATVTGNLELLSTDAGASSAPLIELYRHSASPAAEDFLGRIDFYGEDDNDDKVRYGSITSSIFHPTNGNERGRMEIDVMQNGSMVTFIELAANGVYLNRSTFVNGDLQMSNADGDADADPTLTLRRTSSSPAFNDQLGEIIFQGRNDNFENVNYGRITTKIATVTDGNEGGNLSFNVLQGGSEAEFMTMAFDNIFAYKQLTMFNNIFLDGGYGIKWDGSTNDSNTTTLVVTDPTGVRTITLPDATGTVLVDDGSGNVSISGNLTVSGTTTTVNSSTLSVQDPLIILANNNNSSDAVDIGFYGLYDTSGSQDLYAGLFRDASDSGKFKLFKDLQVEPTTTVNTSGTGYAVGTLVAGLEVPSGSVLTLKSDNSNPAMVIQGSGPNEIMFAADQFGNATDGVSLLYRTTPNNLEIVKASGLGVIAKFNGNTGVAELWHNNNGPKLATTSGGIEVTGTVTDDGAIHDGDVTFTGANGNIVFDKSDDALEFSDSSQIKFGSDFDAFLRHTGSNLELISSTGDIIIADTTGDVRIQGKYGEQSIVANNDGSVELYNDNVKQFETTSTGASIRADEDDVGLVVGKAHIGHVVHNDYGAFSHYDMRNSTGGYALLQYFNGQTLLNAASGQTLEFRRDNTAIGIFETDGSLTLNHGLSMNDNVKAVFGTGNDLEIFHDSGNSFISDAGTGDLVIQATHLRLRGASTKTYFLGTDGGSVELYHDNVKKFETRSNGFAYLDSDVNVEITNQSNQGAIEIGGTSGAFIDLKSPASDDYDARIQVNSSNLFTIYSDDLHLASKTAETYLDATADGSVNLYYDNVKTFETTADGIKVTAPNLGTSNGDTETVADFHINNGNGSSLKINKIRDGNGSNWNTSATRIQQVIDVTKQGYIQFNGNDNLYGLELGTTGSEKFFRGIYNGAVELYHDNVKKIETTSTGATITGELVVDDLRMTTGANSLLKFTSNDGSEGYQIKANVSNTADFGLLIEDLSGNDIAKFLDGGAVELYHNHIKTFETTASGAKIHGNTGDAVLLLEADTTNSDEADNAYIEFSQDGGGVTAKSGIGINTGSDGGNRYTIETTTGSGTTKFDMSGGTHTRLYYGTTVKLQTESDGVSMSSSSGDTKLVIEADSDNDTEGDNAFIVFKLDGGVETSAIWTGNFGGSNDNSLNLTNAGQFSRGISFGTSNTNGGWETATERMRIARSGDITTFGTNGNITFDYSADSLIFDDNVKITLGTDSDATITHTGSNLEIDNDTGITKFFTGQLYIQGQFGSSDETMAQFSKNGAVQLYYDNELRFRTSSTGVDILGQDDDGTSDNTANIRIIAEGTNEIVTLRSNDGVAQYISRNGDNYGTHLFSGFGTVSPNTVNMLQLTSTGHTSYQDLTIVSTDSGSGENPSLILKRDSSSPADFDNIGNIDFVAENDASEAITVASISGMIDDVTDGTEDGRIRFSHHVNGTHTDFVDFVSNQILFLNEGIIGWYQQNGSYNIHIEGGTPSANRTITLPDATGTVVVQDSNGDATIGGGLTVTGGNSGDVLLTFATDRSWQFQQTGDNASTRLQLKSNVDSKLFDIVNSDGNVTHTFFTSSVDPSMTLTAYDTDATEGPSFNLTRNSSSPATNDLLGTIAFKGEDAGDNATTYAKIQSVITDTTAGTEDGLLRLQANLNGTMTTYYDAGYGANFFFKKVALHTGVNLSFEGSTDDTNETTLTVVDPTADRTITFPDATGTINELLISSGSVSSVSSIDFNSTILTTEFSSYRLVLLNVKSDTDDVDLSMRVGTANSADSSTIYMQSNYVYGVWNNNGSTAQSGPAVNNHQATAFSLAYSAGGLGTGTGENGHFEISLLNANSTSCYKHIRLNQSVYSYYPVAMGRRIDAAVYKSNSALNFMTIFVSSGNIASADYRLYGVK